MQNIDIIEMILKLYFTRNNYGYSIQDILNICDVTRYAIL